MIYRLRLWLLSLSLESCIFSLSSLDVLRFSNRFSISSKFISTDSLGKMARGLGVRLPPQWVFKAATTPARQIGSFAKGDQLQSQQCGCGDEKLERGRCNQRKAAYVRQRGQGSEGDDASAHRGFLIQNTLQCVPLFVDKEGPAKRLWSDAQSNHISVAAL